MKAGWDKKVSLIHYLLSNVNAVYLLYDKIGSLNLRIFTIKKYPWMFLRGHSFISLFPLHSRHI